MKIDVLVVGAGPTGLMMAAEAARFGLTCRIIDQCSKPADHSRALAIQPRTLEIFDHLGIVDRFLEKGCKIRSANPMSGSERLAHISFEKLDSPFPFILSLEQNRTEAILTEYLASFGLQIERGVEFLGLEQDEERVLATLRHHKTGREERVAARWTVGCDGAHSSVRKTLDFPFTGKAFPSVFSLGDVKIDWKFPHDALLPFFSPEGVLIAIPMPGKGRYRLVFQLERCRDLLKEEYAENHGPVKSNTIADPTLEEIEKMVRKYGDAKATVSDPLWLANFRINSRLVESYQKGRVFLAGDAAHIHSPAGGQGMNSGLQDVFNLAWKLKQPEWLQTYTLERRSWGEKLLRATRVATWAVTLRNPIAIALRNGLIRALGPQIERRLTLSIAQLSIQYPKSPIVVEAGSFKGGPKAGMRAPNAPLHTDRGVTDLYSVMRKTSCYHLLQFDGAKIDCKTRDAVVIPIHGAEGIHEIYGVRRPSVYLIRPDGYIGYRG